MRVIKGFVYPNLTIELSITQYAQRPTLSITFGLTNPALSTTFPAYFFPVWILVNNSESTLYDEISFYSFTFPICFPTRYRSTIRVFVSSNSVMYLTPSFFTTPLTGCSRRRFFSSFDGSISSSLKENQQNQLRGKNMADFGTRQSLRTRLLSTQKYHCLGFQK